ncbi:protein FAM177A1 [Poeciliopsis prolifica]|uniref:protein FAM177A1 n=1 Tax=Poeciliopsis prolifica TaxID=188132 RepID=UPI0024136FDB|nr:protein FAM177A1 [Poeciliopsis prolifica]XP_054900570.1 protein FAM177A1 [Poeciliopsis prolifica]
MNTDGRQEVSPQDQETEFDGPPLQKQKRIVYFSSGESLELDDSEEDEAEEQKSQRTPFEEPTRRKRLSFKNVAILVGRMSLLACDFLGERLAGALGLNGAKYQYAVDRYYREQKTAGHHLEDQTENAQLSPGLEGGHYGATGGVSGPCDPGESRDDKPQGRQNRAYQRNEDDSS